MPLTAQTRRRLLTKAAAVLALLAGLGCGAEAPAVKTYPVRGKVALPGGKPFPGGLIEFRSPAYPASTIKGEITSDGGSFSLTTLTMVGNRNQTLPGAPPGNYRVTIIPRMQQQQAAPRPILLPKSYQVKAQEDNEFVLWVELPSKRR